MTDMATDEPRADTWLRHLTTRATGVALTPPAQPEPLTRDEWDRLHGHVTAGRITWTLLDAVLSGDLPATDEQAQQTALSHRHAMGVAVRLGLPRVEVTRVVRRRLPSVGSCSSRTRWGSNVRAGPGGDGGGRCVRSR